MELTRDLRTRRRFNDADSLIECAQCGERLFMPEWSELLDGSRLRHLWACDACGYAFETTVRFPAAVEIEAN
jgi:rubredoxin